MSDIKIDHSSSSEIQKQDIKKANQKNPALNNQASQAQQKPKTTFASVFEETMRAGQNVNLKSESPFSERLSAVHERKDDDSSRDQDKGSKSSSSEDKKTGKSSEEKATPQKILTKQDHSSGGEGGGKGDGGQSFGGQKSNTKVSTALLGRQGVDGIQGTQQKRSDFAVQFESKIASAGQIPKEVLDQIVRSVRIGLNEKKNKEIQLDLGKDFKGLSLKVSVNSKGTVDLVFVAGAASEQRFFEANKKEIADALSERGVPIADISVQGRHSPFGRMA